MPVAIKVENLSKAYQLGEFSTGTLSRDIERMWYRIRGKEDPFLKIGETNDRTVKGGSDVVWSLKDINFQIEQGNAIGIIGRNGAGKSTLLKLLSRVTTPTTGEIKVRGRIASLLEVGTGFHPELTGRENIFLNGAILGMRKKEIKEKFDEIVDFAGVDRYIDTPVKRYSSGMYVRLAFAVAAYLDSETLIVDEVLAVGDAEFQKKCLGKMGDVSRQQGRTVLFVSHNMQAIKMLCSQSILLSNGMLVDFDDSHRVIERYFSSNNELVVEKRWDEGNAPGNDVVKLLQVIVHDRQGRIPHDKSFEITEEVGISIKYKVLQDGVVFTHGANLYNNEDINIFNSHDVTSNLRTEKRASGYYEATMWIPGNLMAEGSFFTSIALFRPSPHEIFVHEQKIVSFEIVDKMKGDSARGAYAHGFPGYVRPLLQWDSKISK